MGKPDEAMRFYEALLHRARTLSNRKVMGDGR
jgi:hypothetical protein